MWLRSKSVQKFGGGALEQTGLDLWSWLQMQAFRARKPSDEVKLLRRVRRERKCLNSAWECYNVMTLARAMRQLPGAFAEVGCYQGATAKLICEMKGDKPLLLFDTFEGLPEDGDNDPGVHDQGRYACSVDQVSNYLRDYEGVTYHKGLFPDSTEGLADQQYAFVHFDVDLYEGTLACLEYFYPRMTPGGVLLSHDYGMLEGVEQAFHDFMKDKPEPLIPQATTQVMVVRQAGVAPPIGAATAGAEPAVV